MMKKCGRLWVASCTISGGCCAVLVHSRGKLSRHRFELGKPMLMSFPGSRAVQVGTQYLGRSVCTAYFGR